MGIAKKLASFVFAIILFTGCASRVIKPPVDLQHYNIINHKLDSVWKLKVLRWNKEKFSGLLVLKDHENVLSIVLLDPSGIKLFEENISINGKISLTQSLGFLKKNKIPEYLGEAIYRIFKKAPDQTSCWGRINNLCWYQDSQQLIKKAKWGPFLLWDATYFTYDNVKTGSAEIKYHAPWSGTILDLEIL